MAKSKFKRALSFFVAIVMVLSIVPFSVFAEDVSVSQNAVSSYSDFLKNITTLETYADSYVKEHTGEDPTALIINYVRSGVERYTSGTWTTFCGPENISFSTYVANKDTEKKTNVRSLKNIVGFNLPNGNFVDFGHMFGCLDMAYHTKNQATADLGSWAGDTCDLVFLASKDQNVKGDVETMATYIRKNILLSFDGEHTFSQTDMYGDLDAFYILKRLESGNKISIIMKNYFTSNLNDGLRAKFFLDNRFDGVSDKNEIRNVIFETYYGNEGIRTLEGTYVLDGVKSDVRRATCFAFADYLYETIKNNTSHSSYRIISDKKSNLAPGITQNITTTLTDDNKQLVYFMSKVDISREDVSVHANYNNNDPSHWEMSRVIDQMNAAKKNHKNVANYTPVVGVNADFYDMSNGRPTGALVMEGKTYNDGSKQPFFAILKDGTPVVGEASEWSKYKDNVQEAVGARPIFVRDGKINQSAVNSMGSRMPRTLVGITYDGQIVLMVIDGRQAPYSTGGNGRDIVNLMIDNGCVQVANLDGGGSTTFVAKEEGENELSVVNSPSDGYDRSVSSSLMVVSTAKPSNVFDHAIVSAEYDYLTVGTDIEIEARGATATGGAFDLPQGSYLKVSDTKYGTLSKENIFTAKALGDVQIQLLAKNGTILGSKTLHIVQPTEISFTKSNINVVYGETGELPINATFNGNLVKINPDDINFGFFKVSLTDAGQVLGEGNVSMTKTTFVNEYPEAGVIDGFKFTPNINCDLRMLGIGAVLRVDMPKIEKEMESAYNSTYSLAKQQGKTDAVAKGEADDAANAVLSSKAVKLDTFLYNKNEASFDFNNTNGGSSMFAWTRDVPNSYYKSSLETYYLTKDGTGETDYTFAVDMSKVPIPEQLSGLLYMLPGGDDSGRTAWDFLLQLAERVGPMTTVTITMNIPDGFDIDITNIRLANEYFTLESSEVKDNKLILTCKFVTQTSPINPASANPLCVLSGVNLIPKKDAKWTNGKLPVSLNGVISYDIYAHFHVLKGLASQKEFQDNYGLFPYDNSENDPNDYGAHFMNDLDSFSDSFEIVECHKDGWERENGSWVYYQDYAPLTGIQYLPSHVNGESGSFWYDLGEGNTCKDKLTGLFEKDGKYYYSVNGVLQTKWQSVSKDGKTFYNYYFDENTKQAYTGVRTIDGDFTYTFDNEGREIRGAFVDYPEGTKYYSGGRWLYRQFVTLEEGTYWLTVQGYVAKGHAPTVTTDVKDTVWCHFDEKTGLMTGISNGLFYYDGSDTNLSVGPGKYYCDKNGHTMVGTVEINGKIVYSSTRGKIYQDQACYVVPDTVHIGRQLQTGYYYCDKDGYIIPNGFVSANGKMYYLENYKQATGLRKIGYYYYLFGDNGEMRRNGQFYVPENSTGISGTQTFGPGGELNRPGIVRKIMTVNGKVSLVVGGEVRDPNTLVAWNNNQYVCMKDNGQLAKNETVYVTKADLPSGAGWYAFDKDGNVIKTGFVKDNSSNSYYYNNGVRVNSFTKIGNDYYSFNTFTGKMFKNADVYVGTNSYGIKTGIHHFNNEGKLSDNTSSSKKQLITENLKRYMTVDKVKVISTLTELDGNYYYSKSNGELAANETVYVSTYLLSGNGWYNFDKDGKLVKTGFVKDTEGNSYYYNNGVRAKDLVKIGNDYYMFNSLTGKLYTNQKVWVGANAYSLSNDLYVTDGSGKLTVK